MLSAGENIHKEHYSEAYKIYTIYKILIGAKKKGRKVKRHGTQKPYTCARYEGVLIWNRY